VGGGKYAKVGEEKLPVLIGCLEILGVVGGLTRGFWAVFEGVGEDLFCPGPARTARDFAWRGAGASGA